MLNEWITALRVDTPLQFLFAIVVILLFQLRTAMRGSRRYILVAVMAILFTTFVVLVVAALLLHAPEAMISASEVRINRDR